MLKPGENCLYFPVDNPHIDLTPFRKLKPRPGEYFAVLDPPREKTKGGVYLLALEDGWSQNPEDVDYDAAEAKYNALCEEFARYSRECKQANRVTYQMRTRWDSLYDQCMSAKQELDRIAAEQGPGTALEERPDSYTVVSVGEGVNLTPGERVMLAPYAPRRLKELFGVPDVCLIGLDDPWEDITILRQSPLNKEWEMVGNWIAVEIETIALDLATLKKKRNHAGYVIAAGPNAESEVGQHVVLHRDRTLHRPDDTKWFATKYGPWDGRGVLLVREVDSEGERRVLGVIHAKAQG